MVAVRKDGGNRDTQQAAVYAWERALPEWPDSPKLTEAETEALVRRVFADYLPGQRLPKITHGGRTWSYGGRWELKFSPSLRTKLVVLHEVAHALATEHVRHGPKFATLLLELYARYGGVDKGRARKLGIEVREVRSPHKRWEAVKDEDGKVIDYTMAANARRRVHFAKVAEVPQPVSRAYRQWAVRRQAAQLAVTEARTALAAIERERPAR